MRLLHASMFAPLLAAFLAAPAAAQPEVSSPIRYTLPNGLSVVLDPLPGRSTVAMVVSVDGGRRDQPPGWTGLAHLTEHLLFTGTPALPGEMFTPMEGLGVTHMNGTTSDDATSYYEVVPSGRLEQALWLEAERFAHGMDGLTSERLELQQRVLDRERDLRTERRSVTWEHARSVLYPEGHPYATPIERRDDVHAISVDGVRWFFQRHYMPDRLTLSLSGGFAPDEARAWIERYFGPLARGPITAPAPTVVPPRVSLAGERRVFVEARRASDALVVMWPTPAWGARGDAELDFVARELEHRLEERLVRTELARSVTVRQSSRALASTFRVTIGVPLRAGTHAVLEALDTELGTMRHAAMDAPALEAWRRALTQQTVLQMEGARDRARRFSRRTPSMPGGVYDLAYDLERYRQVTPDGARAAVQTYLPTARRLVVSLSGRADAPTEGEIVRDITVGGAP